MSNKQVSKQSFLQHAVGRTFGDVVLDNARPFQEVLDFFEDESRQKRMEDAEIHHDRPALAGVIRELESLPAVNQYLSEVHTHDSNRFRQAIGVLVGIIMEQRGWRKTGRKGSLGVRAEAQAARPRHNTGGLALWFVRAERFERVAGMPFASTRERRVGLLAPAAKAETAPQESKQVAADISDSTSVRLNGR